MTRAQIRTEKRLYQPIVGLTKAQLQVRFDWLGKLLDAAMSPKWYAIVLERYQETRAALRAVEV